MGPEHITFTAESVEWVRGVMVLGWVILASYGLIAEMVDRARETKE